MHQQTFVTLAIPDKTVSDVLLLAASIRNFGGAQANAPIWVFLPDGLGYLSTQEKKRFIFYFKIKSFFQKSFRK